MRRYEKNWKWLQGRGIFLKIFAEMVERRQHLVVYSIRSIEICEVKKCMRYEKYIAMK